LGEDVDDEIFEVCRKFLDERIPDRWILWRRTDHIVRKGEEEERSHHDHVCARDEQFQSDYDDSADDDCGSDNAGGCARRAGRNVRRPDQYNSTEDDGGAG
jgi:hypothetical protein